MIDVERLTGTERITELDDTLAAVEAIAAETDCTVQGFDARYVADETHLRRALTLADRAFDRGENVARDRAVEILLYAAGRRQITDALKLGVSAGENRVVALVDAGDDVTDGGDAEADAAAAVRSDVLDTTEPTLGDYDPDRVRAYFDIDDAELAVVDGDLEALVCERVALLVVEK